MRGWGRVALLGAALLAAGCEGGGTGAPAEPSAPAPALTPADPAVFFNCLRERGAAIVAAHRGGPAPGYPEAAIETLERTLTHGPMALEVDVRRTRDGVLVLMHDESLERTTTGSGLVADHTLDSLRTLRLRDPGGRPTAFAIPTLAETLAWARGRTLLELDVKPGVPMREVVEAVRAAQAERSVLIITYSDADAARVHALAPDLLITASAETGMDLVHLRGAGVRLERMVAWTGVDQPDPGVFAALRSQGVEPAFGTLGPPGRWTTSMRKKAGRAGSS